MKLIAFNGFKQSGKNTAADVIKKRLRPFEDRLIVKETGFAHKLKIMAALALGNEGTDAELLAIGDALKEDGVLVETWWPGEDYEMGEYNSRDQITGRQFLQFFGGHARRVFGEGFWVDQVLPLDPGKLRTLWCYQGRSYDYGLITDLRYPNEAERVLELGGIVVEVTRPGTESDGHSSEQPLPRNLVTRTLRNDDSLEMFEARVGGLLSYVMENEAEAYVRINEGFLRPPVIHAPPMKAPGLVNPFYGKGDK